MNSVAMPKWVSLVRATAPCWRIVKFEYIAPEDARNNQSVNTYIKCLDAAGNFKAGVKVWQDWRDDRAREVTRSPATAPDFMGETFGATFYMSGDSSFDPGKGQVGPYAFYMDGMSDRVNGLGLPLRRHVQYLITFQRVTSEEPNPPSPPPPAGGAWRIVEQSATRLVLEWK